MISTATLVGDDAREDVGSRKVARCGRTTYFLEGGFLSFERLASAADSSSAPCSAGGEGGDARAGWSGPERDLRIGVLAIDFPWVIGVQVHERPW